MVSWKGYVVACLAIAAHGIENFPPKNALTVLGPVYQATTNTTWPQYASAASHARDTILQSIASGVSPYGPLDNQSTSFSIAVFSATDNSTIFDFHFEAPQLNGSYTRGKLSDDTIYRTGSIGKLLTVYAWLVDISDSVFLDPITKYVPELAQAVAAGQRNPILHTNWDEVTIGSLASQLSGIGRDVFFGDFALSTLGGPTLSEDIAAGYPPLTNETIPQCSSYSETARTCTRQEFIDGLLNHPPAFPSYTTPQYSNIAYVILGLAFENITGCTLEDAYIDLYHNKLGMLSTTAGYPGSDVDAVIPRNDSYAAFSLDIGLYWPAGGQYSTIKDFTTWGQAILQSSQLSSVATRRWLQPTSSTAQWTNNVGAPWEIRRLPVLANTNTSRIVDIYAKGGDIGQYSTFFGVVPDHKIGVTVLAAGDIPTFTVLPLKDLVLDIFINAAEAAAKQQAKNAFTGTFRATDRNSSISLAVDEGPGVSITAWVSNSTDFLRSNPFFRAYDDFRLYPTELSTVENGVTYFSYRGIFTAQGGQPYSDGLFNELNDPWLGVDNFVYNNKATDNFVVGIDQDGIVQSIQSAGLRVTMVRAS